MAPSGLDMDLRLGKLNVDMKRMDASELLFHAGAIELVDTRMRMRTAPGAEEPDPYPTLINPFVGLDITVKELGLKNVAFSMANTSTGDSLWMDVRDGKLMVENMDLATQHLQISSLLLAGIHFGSLTTIDTLARETAAPAPPAWLDQHDGFRFWLRGMDLAVRDLSIDDGDLSMHRGAITAPSRLFDGDHIAFNHVVLRAEELAANDQRLAVHVKELSAIGADASKLYAAVRLNALPALITLDDGSLGLGGTRVHFSASAAPGDLSVAYRSPKQVPLTARIASAIDLATLPALLEQLGIALPKPLNGHEVWNTELAFRGTAQRTDTLRLDVAGDRGTAIHLTADARDLADLPKSVFHAHVREITMGAGLREIVSAYMPPNIPLPERFTGSVLLRGTGDALAAELALASDLGDVEGTIGASGLQKRIPDALNADLSINNVEIQRFTGDTSIGPVSAHLLAEGRLLNTFARSGKIDLTPSQLTYQGQDLSGSQVVATLQGDSIHATVNTTAPALALDLRTDLLWPIGSDTVSGALALRVERLGLKELGWYEQPLSVQGEWEGSGVFSADGFAHFEVLGDSVLLSNAERSFRFEEFAARGHLSNDSTLFALDSDALEVEYSTNVPVDSLLPRTREILLSFFRADSTSTSGPGQRMDLRVALPRTEWLTAFALPDLKAIELKEFTGHYDSDADALRMNIDLPMLRYQGLALSNLALAVDAQGTALDAVVRIDSARYNAFHLDGLALTAASGPGVLRTALRITEGEAASTYVVPIEFRRANGEVSLHVAEGLVLDTLSWAVDPLNILRFTDAGPMAEHFVLSNGPQRAELITSANNTLVKMEQFKMGNVLNIVSTDDTTAFVAGALSGEVSIPLSADEGLRADLRVDDLALTGVPMGDLVIKAQNAAAERYDAEVRFVNGQNKLDANVQYDGGGPVAGIAANADIALVDMSFLRPFVGAFLYDLSGGLNGTVDWNSNAAGKSLEGDLTFTNTMLGVVRTGARYQLRNERVLADRTGFTFDRFTVLDSLGNAIVLDGKVFTEDLVAMRFDLDLRTDSFQLAGSDHTADELLYGDLFASADVRITGTDRAPVIEGELGILPGTDVNFVLPGSEVKLVESEGIVEFTTDLYGTDTSTAATDAERLRDSLRAQLPEIDLDLKIRVDDEALFAVVLDPTTGDKATFRGEGDLQFRYTPEGEMFLTGPFTVSEGGYTLEFYGLVKKRFDLLPGSQVVWDGDPLDARMDIRARYISETAAYPLVANAVGELGEAERNRLAQRLPFEVIINIGGAIEKPDITFGIDLPREYRNSYSKVDQELDRLAEKSKDEERNRQVFGLLVFDTFIQDDAAGGAPSSSLATSAARNSVNGILTEQMNKATGSLVKGVDVQLGVSTVDQVEGASTYQQTNVDYKVSKSFMDERLSFEVGGSLAVDEKQGSTSSVGNSRAAQYAILYTLTEDGRFRLRGFHESAFDLYDGDITQSGGAIIFTMDYEENENAREQAREIERKQQAEERLRRKGERDKRKYGDHGPTEQPAGP